MKLLKLSLCLFSSVDKKSQYFRHKFCLSSAFTLLSLFSHSPILKMDATCSSETPVAFRQTTRRYIPEDRTLRKQCCENPKCCTFFSLLLPTLGKVSCSF
jgi:hypothetical protein